MFIDSFVCVLKMGLEQTRITSDHNGLMNLKMHWLINGGIEVDDSGSVGVVDIS